MSVFRVRSFQGRIFLAILLVVLLPAAVAVAGGALTLRSIGIRSGTLGAWDAVAESGQALLDAVERTEPADPAVREAAIRHREALSGSVRMSRLYTFVVERVIQALPLGALLAGLAAAALAFLTARVLSRGFGRPVAELAGWTERIARGEALPPAADEPGAVRELDTLRQALRRMAGQIEEGKRKAVEHARMRSWTNLARRVAHEIKNPLTPMRMAAASLGRGRDGAEAAAVSVLLDEIHRLDELARTFSQYGRVPEGPRSRVDLAELARLLCAQHGSERIPVRVVVLGSAAVQVDGHYDALERALRNLVLNAVEAQEVTGGEVDVTVTAEAGEALVRVEDRGPGIEPELMEEIWNPDVTTKSRGTGLGLALVRQTVAHHDGAVAVTNRPGGGARFEVRLPLIIPASQGDTSSERRA
jgi:signal transduction histidine kinase